MKPKYHPIRWLSGALLLLGTWNASAHTSYTNRNFGTIVPNASPVTISGQAVTGSHGWADGTDEDFGDSHRVRAFRFKLDVSAHVTISFSGSTNGGTRNGSIKPGFSVYRGLAHVPPVTDPPGSADYDDSPISLAYLATLGGVPKEGAFRALETWRMGGDNQPGPTFDFDAADGLSTFTFVGYAVDGNSSLFGSAPGIVGDGNADGTVSKTFLLTPGDYSIFVGGANYSAQDDTVSYGLTGTVHVGYIAGDPAAGGIGYAHQVTLDRNSNVALSSHVGSWSWEDNDLFAPGEPPVGWTHTSSWVALRLLRDSNVTVTMARDANVPWPSQANPDRKASIASMFPSMTIYRGWDNDGDDDHTYNNRGNIDWAEDVAYVDHFDNSTLETFTRTWFLPAGDYSLALGSNSPAKDTDRQGFSATFTTEPSIAKDPVPTPAGIGYARTVTLTGGDTGNFSSHVGSWSWEDNALFAPGQPPVGWTHTSRWLALNVEQDSFVTLKMERDATVPWPSQADPNRLADTESMFPSLTIYRGWDNDGTDNHTYNNRGNIVWAEDVRYVAHVDNSTREAITRTWRLPAGRYSVALGSNAPATDADRQGFKLTYSAAAFAPVYTGDPAAGGIGYSWVVTAGRGSSGTVSNHVGSWSWEDDSLFTSGQPPVGWTHTSRWLALLVTEPLTFNVTMARNANVPWPSQAEPGRLADTSSMFPSLTLWRGWYNHGSDSHTYNNRGNVAWAPDLEYVDHLDNSSAETVTRSWTLTPGTYTFALGSNAPATDPDRQGFSFSWTTSTPRFDTPIISDQPRSATVVEGRPASFQVGARGANLQIQWFHNGSPLPGATSAKLTIPVTTGADAGSYVAEVRNPAGWDQSQAATLVVLAPPQLTAPTLPELTIGQSANFALGAVPNSSYVITGLPRGLTYNRQTGAISGRPLVSGTFPISIQLVNAAGSSAPVNLNLVIDPMPEGTVGTFAGIVERSPGLNQLLGGVITITSTDRAAFSVTLRLGGATYRGSRGLTVAQGSETPTGHIEFPVRGRSPVVVDFTIQSDTGVAEGTVSSGAESIAFTARQPVATPADFAGDHTFALAPAGDDASNPAVPQGYSFGTLVVNSLGRASGTVRLADNTSATFSGPIEVDGNLSVFVPLYRNGGSFLGLVAIQGGVSGGGDLVLSELDWFKSALPAASRERVYKDGFGPVNLETTGRRIQRTQQPLTLLGLTANAAGNARLTFRDGGAPAPETRLDTNVEVKAGDAQAASVIGANPGLVRLVTRRPLPAPGVRPALTGASTGQFTLVDSSHTRVASFQGMIVHDGAVPKLFGFFLLPELPQAGPPVTTLRTSPMLSGKVLLEPLAPSTP
jgi:hypothetical protein